MEDKSQDNKPRFFQVLKELAELQATNMKLQAAIFIRESKEQVDEKVADMAHVIRESAKDYGKKAEKLAEEYAKGKQGKEDVISRYRECLEQINEEYSETMMDIFEKKQELEEDEITLDNHEYALKQRKKEIAKSPEYKEHKKQEKLLVKDIKKATSDGRLEEATQMIEELSELQRNDSLARVNSTLEKIKETRDIIEEELKECNAQIKECKRDRVNAIKEATSDKNIELQNIDKASIARRLLGGILNRINGVNRFKNIVIKSIGGKVDKLAQEVLPVIKENAEKKREEASERFQDVRTRIVERAQAGIETITEVKDFVGDKAKDVADRGRSTFSNIIQRGREAKERMITTMQKRVEDKKEKVAELQEQYEEETYHGAHFKKEENNSDEEQR